MSLPNATKILTTIPAGMRATVSRGSTVATYAIRTAIHDLGQLSPSALDRDVRANVWTISADFNPRVSVGDVLTVDGVSAVVVDAMLSCGSLVNRAAVLLFENTVSVSCNGQTTQALHSALTDDESFGDFGQRGLSTGRLRIIASTLSQPEKGATIIVNGKSCIVGTVSTDPRNGLMTLSYQQTTDV